jgi:hypothetical protein
VFSLDVGAFQARTLAAVLVAAATGCGTPGDAADAGVAIDATGDGGAPGIDGSACVAAGGYCTSEPFCVANGDQPCGPTMDCCFDTICAPEASIPPIQASNYDRSCAVDSDCVAVAEGDVCTPCGVGCKNAAINVAARAQYQADVDRAFAATLPARNECVTTCRYYNSQGPCCLSGQCVADGGCPGPTPGSDGGLTD